MKIKVKNAFVSAAIASLILVTVLSTNSVKAAVEKVTRTSGTDRYSTAASIAMFNWENGSNNVVLASGEGYADGLSASTLAKKLDAPILLTTSDTLSKDTENAISTLKPKNIYIVGGTASISEKIRNNLKNKYNIIELAGNTRYETNVKVANKLVELGVNPDNVLAVSGEGFSDAISAAPVAAAKGEILLLVNNDEASIKSTISFLKGNKSKVTVIGTDKVINDKIYNVLGASERIDGGKDRFATNLNILNAFWRDLNFDKMYIASAQFSEPDDMYADALVASAISGKYSAPLVLVDKDSSDATDNAVAYIIKNNTSNADILLIGGTEVISENIEDRITPVYNPLDNY
ncbi:cell wall-binding protein [Clostridium carboxidivorans P7]|uniref:Putative cell wall binding repeat 2-containing protein n=1 Tax=Clostridium carboxidivorans P7 TaxID=536227 RepID=C6PMW0_9CLOT|nr:cell wall-binding repeat-containing protein [Clostridium carboxidivorans]AKN29810.1 cell wall-binding protein [Clostridium carboxidivorans P7]EET89538.1 putative cell wall binding repeat 2-containing protein [Clostridium carboxidivorans P7]